jgi:putative sterol carrier protein
MATVEECRTALEKLAQNLGGADGRIKKAAELNRSVSCRITDLDVTFNGCLRDGSIRNLSLDPAPKAQIRLAMSGDDLVSLVDGRLNFASAWASGRVKLSAGVMDLLQLRKLI